MKLVRIDKQGNKHAVSIEYLHEKTNLSLSRFKRAWLALIDAGIAKSFKQYEEDEGVYKGLPSIKTISPDLFSALSLSKRLKNSRDYASERQRQQKARQTPATKAAKEIIDRANSIRASKAMKKAIKGMFGGKRPQSPKIEPPPNNHINNLLAGASWNK